VLIVSAGFKERDGGSTPSWYNVFMPVFLVQTPGHTYVCKVARDALLELGEHIPARAGKVFVVTERAIWELHGRRIGGAMTRPYETLFFEGGEERKRLSEVERLAEQMVQLGADRSSIVVAFGGGIVGDLTGFLAAIFMRGIPFIQAPTTLLAQVDAAIGGKTGANLVAGKNLVGCFHQPRVVLIDPTVLSTLPARELRAGLYEILKAGVIRSSALFDTMFRESRRILALDPEVIDEIIAESVAIKAEVVSADERESDLRRILNFGHTVGHALEAETAYSRLLHGEAVAFGMRAASHLARLAGVLPAEDCSRILDCIDRYGALPSLDGVRPERLMARLGSDKKTVQGKVHFVLPEAIGKVRVMSGLDAKLIEEATETALTELSAQTV
jgi:3-dehydroquinate synthase